jgi:phosphoesterase RecJ-like protein
MNINLLNESDLDRLRQLISEAKKVVVCCHQNPGGDAIGGVLAWSEYLREQGKELFMAVPDMFPDFLQWLPNTEKVVRYDKHKEQVELLMKTADLICCLDFNTPSRTEELAPVLTSTTVPKVLIDHHLKPDVESVLTISFPEMSSTSELIFRIVWQMGGFETLGRQFAVPLYCGMMTDTGGFTFNSSRPEIFFIISQLLTKGIDKDKIYRNVYHNYSEDRLRLMGYMMYQKLRTDPSRHAS